MLVPEELKYQKTDEWVKITDGIATIGITDYAQEKLGDILSVEFIETDTYVERDETFGSIESVKEVVDLISPVSGTVVIINEDIVEDVSIVNRDPYDTGWLVVIEMDNLDQLEDLLAATNYQDFIMREENE